LLPETKASALKDNLHRLAARRDGRGNAIVDALPFGAEKQVAEVGTGRFT
jgi:hypothetical protein